MAATMRSGHGLVVHAQLGVHRRHHHVEAGQEPSGSWSSDPSSRMSTSIPVRIRKRRQLGVESVDHLQLRPEAVGRQPVGHGQAGRVVGHDQVLAAETAGGQGHDLDRLAAVGPVGMAVAVSLDLGQEPDHGRVFGGLVFLHAGRPQAGQVDGAPRRSWPGGPPRPWSTQPRAGPGCGRWPPGARPRPDRPAPNWPPRYERPAPDRSGPGSAPGDRRSPPEPRAGSRFQAPQGVTTRIRGSGIRSPSPSLGKAENRAPGCGAQARPRAAKPRDQSQGRNSAGSAGPTNSAGSAGTSQPAGSAGPTNSAGSAGTSTAPAPPARHNRPAPPAQPTAPAPPARQQRRLRRHVTTGRLRRHL